LLLLLALSKGGENAGKAAEKEEKKEYAIFLLLLDLLDEGTQKRKMKPRLVDLSFHFAAACCSECQSSAHC